MEKFEPRKLPTVLTADELLDKAFRRASKVTSRERKRKNMDKLTTVMNVINDYLNRIILSHPSYENLPPFYREMVDNTVGIRKIKKSLAALNWANEMTKKVAMRGVRKIKKEKDPINTLKSSYGRISSIIEQIDPQLRFLNESRILMRKIPTLTDDPTIVVAGYPNVGKSSFVSSVSTVKPEIATYPFTTKELFVGYRKWDNKTIQIIDTPGLFDRPLHKRNQVELRAIYCLKYLADCIMFIIDPTETCGYSLESQESLLEEIRHNFDVKVITVYCKSDLHQNRDLPAFSNLTGEGVDIVLEMLLDELELD